MRRLYIILIFLALGNVSLFAGNHHIAVFLGATSNLDAEHTDFTIGGDYAYRLSDLFSLGLIGDVVLADYTEILIMPALTVHPMAGGLRFFAAPGIAIIDTPTLEIDDSLIPDGFDVDIDTESESVSEFVLRLGGAYDIHVGNFAIAPTFSADFISGHVSLVYGMAFGLGF